jgi:hypothetical protein
LSIVTKKSKPAFSVFGIRGRVTRSGVYGEDIRQSGFSSPLADNKGLRQRNRRHGRISGDGRKIIYKLIQSLPAVDVIQQRLKRYTCPSENRSPSENIRIPDDDIDRLHGSSPVWALAV